MSESEEVLRADLTVELWLVGPVSETQNPPYRFQRVVEYRKNSGKYAAQALAVV